MRQPAPSLPKVKVLPDPADAGSHPGSQAVVLE